MWCTICRTTPRAQWTRVVVARRPPHHLLAGLGHCRHAHDLTPRKSWTSPWAAAEDHHPRRLELAQSRLRGARLPLTRTWAEARQPLAAEVHQVHHPMALLSPFKPD